MADITYLIYSSTPFGYDAADLNGILLTARRNNGRDGITGALVCRHDVYLQYLEGAADQVEAIYLSILCDDRHVDVKLRAKGAQDRRLFGDWAMMHDPAQSLIWSIDEVDAGAMDRASSLDYLSIFTGLSAKARAA